MKTAVLVSLLMFVAASRAFAQWAVIDAANLQQSVVQYAALIEQISNQATQISHQVQQIQQFETRLKRLGDMATVKDLVGFPELKLDLTLPTKVKTWAESLGEVDGYGLFGDTRGGIFREISLEFPDFDGVLIERQPAAYKRAHEVTNKVDNFKEVQSDVYTRRENLKKAIAETSEAVRLAETDAEAKKQEAVLNAQYSQLVALDAEVALSAVEIQVKAAESTAMVDAQNEADAEARSRLAQQESRKLATAFKPAYECMLEYVTERRMSP